MTCEPTHNYLYTLYHYEWYEPMRLLIYRHWQPAHSWLGTLSL